MMTIRTRSIGLVATLLVASACGSKDSGNHGADADGSGDVAGDAGDAGLDTTTEPDTEPDVAPDVGTDTIAPDVPVSPTASAVQIVIAPSRAVFAPGAIVTPTATVFDQFGDAMPGVATVLTASPTGATSEASGAFTLLREGEVTFSACAGDVCGERSVLVDGGPPTLELISPLPGTMLRADEAPVIEVEGIVVDGRGTASVFVNGRLVDVDESGVFTTTLTPRFGVNHVEVTATDGVFPVEARAAADVIWALAYLGEPVDVDVPDPDADAGGFDAGGDAGGFDAGPDAGGIDADVLDAGASDVGDTDGGVRDGGLSDAGAGDVGADVVIPPPEPVAMRLEDGVVFRLSQRFLDDAEPLVIGGEATVVAARDLAGIVELLVHEVDVMSLVPNPVVDSAALQLFVDDLDLGDVIVSLELVDGGIDLYVELPAVVVQTRGFVELSGASLDLSGSVVASLAARGQISVTKPDRDAPLVVSVPELDLALTDATSAFVSPEADAVFALAESALFGVVEGLLVDTVSGAFLDQIPGLVESVLVSLDETIGGAPFVLDTGLFPPIALSFNGDMASLVIAPHDAMSIGIDLDLATDADAIHTDSRGVALANYEGTEPSLLSTSRVQAAVRLSVINGLLHALWDSGLLQIDASAVIPDEFSFLIDTAIIDGKLPPIMSAASPDQSDFGVLLSLGQAELIIGRGAQRDRLGMYLTAGVDIGLDGGALTLAIESPPRIQLWTIEVGGPTPLFADPADLESLIATGIWPMLSESLGESLAIDLPSFDVSAAGAVAPTLSDLTLELVIDRPIAIRDGFLMLDGALEGIADISE